MSQCSENGSCDVSLDPFQNSSECGTKIRYYVVQKFPLLLGLVHAGSAGSDASSSSSSSSSSSHYHLRRRRRRRRRCSNIDIKTAFVRLWQLVLTSPKNFVFGEQKHEPQRADPARRYAQPSREGDAQVGPTFKRCMRPPLRRLHVLFHPGSDSLPQAEAGRRRRSAARPTA